MKDTSAMDLSIKIAGIVFKNPVLPSASELVFDGKSAKMVAEAGVGGIVTKTFTSPPEDRIRLRPYQFPLARFSSAFRRSGSFYSLAGPHVEDMDVVIEKNVPEMAQVCKSKEIPLIVSFYERPGEITA